MSGIRAARKVSSYWSWFNCFSNCLESYLSVRIARVRRNQQDEVVNDIGRKLPKVPRGIARVFINFIVFTSW